MAHLLYTGIRTIGTLLLLLVAANVLLDFGKWALGCLLVAAQAAGHEALRVSVTAYRATTRYLSEFLKRLTVRALKTVAKGAAVLWQAAKRRTLDWLSAHVPTGWADRWARFGQADKEEERATPSDAPPRSPYEEALDLLGLANAQPLTRDLLKRRYAEIIRIVHPDKGFPNRVFAQQVNDAVTTIKRRHNWR